MRRARLDQAAMVLSGVCMVHCIASVAGLFAIGLLASFGGVDEIFHRAMLVLIVPLSAFAIIAGYRRHRRLAVLVPGLAALTGLCLMAAFEEALHGFWEPLLTSLVGIGLIATHFGNIRACKVCEGAHNDVSHV